MTIRFLISFLMYFSFSIFAHSQEKGEIRPNIPELISIREEIIEMIDRKEIPSMAVAISKGDTVLWMEALGYADIEKGTKPSISSLYPVGSISKSITATLVMSMINQGEISLSSDIGKLIAPLKILDIDGKQHSVPIWSVMNMTSGVNHGYSSFELESLPKSKKEKINFLKGQIITAFEPGTVYEYSNHSYSILELMIENIRNQRIQLVAPEVLNKIEMTNTLPLYTGGHDKFVKKYNTKLEELPPSYAFPGGGQGYHSSVEDLLNYGMFHAGIKRNDEFISPENLKLMHAFRQGPADLFSLGWFTVNERLISNGNVTGGNANLTIDPKEKLVIVCLLNRTSWDGIADKFAEKIQNVFTAKDCNNGYETWQRIYEPPYTSRFELIGEWEGQIKDPRLGQSEKVRINFMNDGQIKVTIGDHTIEMNNPYFNLLQEFGGSWKLDLPFENSPGSVNVKLKYDNGELQGYASGNVEMDDYNVYQPYYLKFKRTKNK